MKSTNKKIYLQWLGITVFITLVCLSGGLYITRYLTMKEESNRRELWKEREKRESGEVTGPLRHRLEIMRSLVEMKKFSAEESFELVDKSHYAPFPEASYLMDDTGKMIRSHVSKTFKLDDQIITQEVRLGPNRMVRLHFPNRLPPFRPSPQDRGHGHHKRFPPGPPPGAFLVGIVAVVVSIVIGIALSLVLITAYLRKRAHQVKEIMEEIKKGNLKARFKINSTDESGLLMNQFNEMAGEIEKLVNNLRETEETRTKLLQELAHDLRTPIASVKTLQETLMTKGSLLDAEKRAQFEGLVMKEINYFEYLVEDLLFLSGVNDLRYTQNLRSIELNDLIGQELEIYEDSGKKTIWAEGSSTLISSDENLLRRLLKNAFSNAFRHATSQVTVTLTRENQHVVLRITDDGPGMKEELLQNFGEKKFSREISTDTKGHISIGLGSVIMKKIMALHNGTLSVKNKNPGIELKISFPV